LVQPRQLDSRLTNGGLVAEVEVIAIGGRLDGDRQGTTRAGDDLASAAILIEHGSGHRNPSRRERTDDVGNCRELREPVLRP
jgi:hypothetical protein